MRVGSLLPVVVSVRAREVEVMRVMPEVMIIRIPALPASTAVLPPSLCLLPLAHIAPSLLPPHPPPLLPLHHASPAQKKPFGPALSAADIGAGVGVLGVGVWVPGGAFDLFCVVVVVAAAALVTCRVTNRGYARSNFRRCGAPLCTSSVLQNQNSSLPPSSFTAPPLASHKPAVVQRRVGLKKRQPPLDERLKKQERLLESIKEKKPSLQSHLALHQEVEAGGGDMFDSLLRPPAKEKAPTFTELFQQRQQQKQQQQLAKQQSTETPQDNSSPSSPIRMFSAHQYSTPPRPFLLSPPSPFEEEEKPSVITHIVERKGAVVRVISASSSFHLILFLIFLLFSVLCFYLSLSRA